jgi:Ca2+-transporting ATPase
MSQFHSVKIEACLSALKSHLNGLSEIEAEKRLSKHGRNTLPEEKPLNWMNILLSQFKNVLVYILVFTGLLSLLLGEIVDGGVIFAAVIINVIVGFIQENKANNAISQLKSLVEHNAIVLRDGNEKIINSRELVVGDIVLIEAGNKIPADARLLEAADLQINESMLTGESIPSAKNINPVSPGAPLADRESMVYAGTLVVHGIGKAVVTATGKEMELGKIAELVRSVEAEKTPLQIRLENFSRYLGMVFGGVCTIIVVTGLIRGRGLLEMVETGAAIGVASIPEGLTVSVTFILALGMRQILKNKALTRKLIAAETLGSTTVICTDKTGTLTEGNMHVAHIVIGEREFEVNTSGSRQDSQEAREVSFALQAAMMCNNAFVENPNDELASWRFIGSPTETALLSAAIQSGLRKEELLKIEPQVDMLPFESLKKFMLSLHRKGSDSYVLYEKGAPEKILAKSENFFHQGECKKISALNREKLAQTFENLTTKGLRLIGLAYRDLKKTDFSQAPEKHRINWSEIDNNLTFIGFIAIKDPLRPEAEDTIRMCQNAGIRTVIITGDHKLTAKAIAREVGLKVKAENIIIGEELDKIDDEKFKKIIKKISVYARVSPHHKLRIVKALQAAGEVVAMTGDGINDSPALKTADIGISLGSGTDIAKESSDIVLLDNNFKTIVSTIKQGRIIFKNIRKVITYLISDSFSEMILIVGSIFFNTPLALLPTQILWINIVNDGLPHFSLAFEKEDDKIMEEKPMEKEQPLLTPEMKRIIFGVGIFRDILLFGIFYYFWTKFENDPAGIEYLVTFIFATLGVKSLLSIFSFRSLSRSILKSNPFSNPYLLIAVATSFSLLVLGVHWHPLQNILSTVDLSLSSWMWIFAFSIFNITLIEFAKLKYITKPKKIVV